MMAKLTMTDGCAVTVHNLALFCAGADLAIEELPGDGTVFAAQAPARCEFTIARKSWLKMRYFARCEIELANAEVFALSEFELLRDSRNSSNVRAQCRVNSG